MQFVVVSSLEKCVEDCAEVAEWAKRNSHGVQAVPEFGLPNNDDLTLQLFNESVLLDGRVLPWELFLSVALREAYRDGNPSILVRCFKAELFLFDCLRSAWSQVKLDQLELGHARLAVVFSATLFAICREEVHLLSILNQFNSTLSIGNTH